MDNKEEQKKLSDAEHLIAMKGSHGWAILMDRYENIVKQISDLRTIPLKVIENNVEKELTTTERMDEMIKREGALSLFESLFGSITADIDYFKETMEEDRKIKEDELIKRFDI